MPSALPVVLATESRENFADIEVSVTAWIVLAVVIVVLLAVDLYRHREAHAPTPREATIETILWISIGLLSTLVVWYVYGSAAFGEYISGYLIEKSLSIDNVFVWSILFSTMSIPLKYQHRVLFWGVFGALVLRLIFILVGTALISRFVFLLVVFGVFLIITGIRIIRHRDDEGENTSTAGLGLLKKIMPVSEELDGDKFFTTTMVNNPDSGAGQVARRAATPLFAALVVVEFTDVIFALDSVPAVLAVSDESFIIFASNAFAILGLRAMYFLLANARERFHYLSHGLGAILIFVGLKMSISPWTHVDTFVSLGIIVAMLVAAVAFSEVKNRREQLNEL